MGMIETDKLLVRIGTARDAISRKTEQTSLDYMIDGVLMNCSVMLKEQESDMIALKNAYKELAEKGSVIVRCKDCIYMEKMNVDIGEGDLIWCSIHEFGREIDYYCADGERRTDDA